MVNSFLIQTISSHEDFHPRMCYWEPYGFIIEKAENATKMGRREAEGLNIIMNRVQAEFLFRKEVCVDDNNRDQGIENGMFRLYKQNIFATDFHVLWHACYGCSFVMLLSVDENIALAEHVLDLVVGYATNIFNMIEENIKQLVAYPDKMTAVLHVFLPSGQLIFMNHRLVKQFEKDLDKILSAKK